MVFLHFFQELHVFYFSAVSPRIVHKKKYPDIGLCRISRSFHFWWFQLMKFIFSMWKFKFKVYFARMFKIARFRCVSHKFWFFVAKNAKWQSETIKNEENAKFYTALCLDTLFCAEFMMNSRKFWNLRKRAILKKNVEKVPPQLMKRTL